MSWNIKLARVAVTWPKQTARICPLSSPLPRCAHNLQKTISLQSHPTKTASNEVTHEASKAVPFSSYSRKSSGIRLTRVIGITIWRWSRCRGAVSCLKLIQISPCSIQSRANLSFMMRLLVRLGSSMELKSILITNTRWRSASKTTAKTLVLWCNHKRTIIQDSRLQGPTPAKDKSTFSVRVPHIHSCKSLALTSCSTGAWVEAQTVIIGDHAPATIITIARSEGAVVVDPRKTTKVWTRGSVRRYWGVSMKVVLRMTAITTLVVRSNSASSSTLRCIIRFFKSRQMQVCRLTWLAPSANTWLSVLTSDRNSVCVRRNCQSAAWAELIRPKTTFLNSSVILIKPCWP